jgi:hypothetical protein
MSTSSLWMKEDSKLIHLPILGLILILSLLSHFIHQITFTSSPVNAKASISACRRSRRKYRSMIKSTNIANKKITTFLLLQSNQQESIASFLTNAIAIRLGRNRNLIVVPDREKLVQRIKACANYHGGSFRSLKSFRMQLTKMWLKNLFKNSRSSLANKM